MADFRKVGDEIVIAGSGHSPTSPGRRGRVLEVSGALLRVRWDDGTESVFVNDCAAPVAPAAARRSGRGTHWDFIG